MMRLAIERVMMRTVHSNILVVVVSLTLVAFVAGCKPNVQTTTTSTTPTTGSTAPPTTTSTAPPTTTTPPTTQTTATGTIPPTSTTSTGQAIITINGGVFFPATLRIVRGTTVQFQNQDHDTITIVSDFPFSVIIPIGGSADIVLDKAGTFLYWDPLAPLDKGTVIVS